MAHFVYILTDTLRKNLWVELATADEFDLQLRQITYSLPCRLDLIYLECVADGQNAGSRVWQLKTAPAKLKWEIISKANPGLRELVSLERRGNF